MFIGGEVLKVVLSLVSMLVVFAIWHRSLVFYPFLLAFLGVSHLVFFSIVESETLWQVKLLTAADYIKHHLQSLYQYVGCYSGSRTEKHR